jgi:hypothetical protein
MVVAKEGIMTLRWEPRERVLAEDPQPWAARLPDGRDLCWRGLFTGPILLSAAELDAAADHLLHIPTSAVPSLAASELRSYISAPGPRPPSMLMHSATATTKGFESDLLDLTQGRPAHDISTYLETRVVSLGRPGDIAVGRTQPWREAVQLAGLAYADVGDVAYYYLSHALLTAARQHDRAPVAAIAAMLDWLHGHPDAVVRVYALDTEMQIFLIWLKRKAGLRSLRVDANSPVVSARWNQKTPIHPPVAAARALRGGTGGDPVALLALEQRRSSAYQLLGMVLPVLPGYLVRRDDGPEAFAADLIEAAALLRERYQLGYGCFKPCEAGDGARIVPRVDLTDRVALASHAREAFTHGDHYLLEAHVDFVRFDVGPRSFDLAPSGHVRGGHVAAGLTAQLMNGCSWAGNALFDERTLGAVGLSQAQYAQMMAAMHAVRDAFYGERSIADGSYQGLVTGGVDFAVGRIGGRFGEQVVIGAIDFNLSSHGAEYMYAFHDEVRDRHPGRYVATRVYRPTAGASLEATDAVVSRGRPDRIARTVCCVPGRWGMIAAAGTDTRDAIMAASGVIAGLVEEKLAEPEP